MTATAPLLHLPEVRPSHRLDPSPAGADTLDTAFELGWDHARHGLTPPLDILCGHLRLQQGFRAGRAACGRRPPPADPWVRVWLELRLQALRRRITFETVQLTPRFLAQIDVPHCPVTRGRLTAQPGAAHEWRVARLRSGAGFAAGHLAVVGACASQARGELGLGGVLQRQRSCQDAALRQGGLDGLQWARWTTLCSLVEPLEHARAAALPLCVLPPKRLRLFNPVQALQALASRALLHARPNCRLAALRAHFPMQARPAFDAWLRAYRLQVLALLPQQPPEAPHWALEDAWQDRAVLLRWQRLAQRLDAAQCERIVLACSEGRARWLQEQEATEGWALEQGGLHHRPPPAPQRRREGGPGRQLALFAGRA